MTAKEARTRVEKVLRSRRTDTFYDDYPESFEKFVKWTLKQLKKAPFYLLNQEPGLHGQEYTLIFWDKEKVKLAVFEDDMYGRYGGDVLGQLTSACPTDFWQRRSDLINAKAYQEMVKVFEDRSTLPEFDFLTIKVRGM